MPKKKRAESEKTKSEKKSRAKYECPPKLKELIELVNLVPPDAVLLSHQEHFKKFDVRGCPLEKRYELIERFVDDLFAQLPEKAQKRILEILKGVNYEQSDDSQFKKLTHRLSAYAEFFELRESLTHLVEHLNHWRKESRIAGNNLIYFRDKLTYPFESEFLSDDPGFILEISVAFSPVTGKAELVLNRFLEAIIGVDLTRLRACEICSRIFWAKRKESETCSPPCLNVFNVRRYRALSDEEKAERRAKREANRNYKKKLKEREKKNGIA